MLRCFSIRAVLSALVDCGSVSHCVVLLAGRADCITVRCQLSRRVWLWLLSVCIALLHSFERRLHRTSRRVLAD